MGAHSKVMMAGPAVESLLSLESDSFWPAYVRENARQKWRSKLRTDLLKTMGRLFAAMPSASLSIEEALKEGVSEAVAIRMYDLLTHMLLEDDNRRLILYFPFELIPIAGQNSASLAFAESSSRFMQFYMQRWRELLDTIEARANFVDGNILERELAPAGQPLVCKAAHLASILVAKGHLDMTELVAMRDTESNAVVRASLDDAVASMTSTVTDQEEIELFDESRIDQLSEVIEAELKKLDMRHAFDHSRGQPPARVDWERKNNEEMLIERYAKRIAPTIEKSRTECALVNRLVNGARSTPLLRIVIRAVREAAEKMTRGTLLASYAIGSIHPSRIQDDALRDEMESMLVRLTRRGVIEDKCLLRYGFTMPDLESRFSDSSAVGRDIASFAHSIREIEKDPALAKLLYPAALFFGSRLKGYARRNSDLDAAVFVMPDTPLSKRKMIRKILAELFREKGVDGKVVEFWLEHREGQLSVRSFPDSDVFLADIAWINLLMSSVWLGKEKVLRDLYATLLAPSVQRGDEKIDDRTLRSMWLGEMERDVLQYRLMHKGYERFYAPAGGIKKTWRRLDPGSMFWDHGYRRLATRLFISRVFLPSS